MSPHPPKSALDRIRTHIEHIQAEIAALDARPVPHPPDEADALVGRRATHRGTGRVYNIVGIALQPGERTPGTQTRVLYATSDDGGADGVEGAPVVWTRSLDDFLQRFVVHDAEPDEEVPGDTGPAARTASTGLMRFGNEAPGVFLSNADAADVCQALLSIQFACGPRTSGVDFHKAVVALRELATCVNRAVIAAQPPPHGFETDSGVIEMLPFDDCVCE